MSNEGTRPSAEGIPPVDPMMAADAAGRAARRVLQIRPVARFLASVAQPLDPILGSLTRRGLWMPLPFASITTTGARSGQPRVATVIYFNDGPDVILVASNYGQARHPAWYHNLVANPTAVLSRGSRSGEYAAAEVTDEAERERLFALANHIYPGFAAYRRRTAMIGRRIPIMRLSPVARTPGPGPR